MASSQIILFSQPRSGSKSILASRFFANIVFMCSGSLTIIFPGHLIERMLTDQQSGVSMLAHPFSASRGKQVQWLLRDDYADGMGGEEKIEYWSKMQDGMVQWEERLVSVHVRSCDR